MTTPTEKPTEKPAQRELPVDQMMDELNNYIESVETPIFSKILKLLFEMYGVKFKTHPAAKRIHGAYSGGLLEHTLNMVRMAESIASVYGDGVNRDLLITGTILHDFGKTMELTPAPNTGYTVSGTMLGHINIQNILIDRVVQIIKNKEGVTSVSNEDDVKVFLLMNMVASHHGPLEYGFGSTAEGVSIESIILHHIDMIESQVNIVHNGLKKAKSGSFTKIEPLTPRFYKQQKGE